MITKKREVNPVPKRMKILECPAPCDFSVKGRDEKEIVKAAILHAEICHDRPLTAEEAKRMIKPA